MKTVEEDLVRRSKLAEKGRKNQKFRNFIKQLDPHNIHELSDDDEYNELFETVESFNYKTKSQGKISC